MKVKILLTAKEDFGTTKKGNTMLLYNDIFDAMNGIAFNPIDRSVWALTIYEQYTGVKDNKSNEIYNSDYVEALTNPEDSYGSKNTKVFGKVCFDMGCFCIHIMDIKGKACGYDVGQKIPLFDFVSIEIVHI